MKSSLSWPHLCNQKSYYKGQTWLNKNSSRKPKAQFYHTDIPWPWNSQGHEHWYQWAQLNRLYSSKDHKTSLKWCLRRKKKKANIKVLVNIKQTKKSVKYFSWIQLKFNIWLPAPFSPMWLATAKQRMNLTRQKLTKLHNFQLMPLIGTTVAKGQQNICMNRYGSANGTMCKCVTLSTFTVSQKITTLKTIYHWPLHGHTFHEANVNTCIKSTHFCWLPSLLKGIPSTEVSQALSVRMG